ncbi:MAG: hypothetical protein FJW30_26840 [Acidobacteria bacterium]|nr:hypothetical protein [Acidobacteriota bacterium]
MHIRRAISFLLGCWFATVLVVAVNAGFSFRVADSTVTEPPAEMAKLLGSMPETSARQYPRFVASEINRAMFERFGLIELALIILIGLSLFLHGYSRAATILSGILLVAVCASNFLITPQLVGQGRILDFRPLELFGEERERFANLHAIYGGLTLFRLLCGSGIAWFLLKRGRNTYRRRSTGEIYAVNNADDSQIDG